MTRSLQFALLILLSAVAARGVVAEPVTASRGVWAGPMGERTAGWPTDAGKIELRIDGSDKRFSVNLTGPGGPLLAGEFQPGSREGVFAPPGPSGLMAFFGFGRRGVVNTLEGQPMVWARRAGAALVVYALIVRDGVYRLERLAVTPTGERLGVAFERREHGKEPERFTAQLERQRP